MIQETKVANVLNHVLSNFCQALLTGKVTEAQSPNAELATASVDELLALVAVLLTAPDGWIRSGSEGLAQNALCALAQGAGAGAIHGRAWRVLLATSWTRTCKPLGPGE